MMRNKVSKVISLWNKGYSEKKIAEYCNLQLSDVIEILTKKNYGYL